MKNFEVNNLVLLFGLETRWNAYMEEDKKQWGIPTLLPAMDEFVIKVIKDWTASSNTFSAKNNVIYFEISM